MELGSWITVTDYRGGYFRVPTEYWDLLETSYTMWIERKIDKVLHLTDIGGSEIVTSASAVKDMYTATPATRAMDREFEQAWKAETGYVEP